MLLVSSKVNPLDFSKGHDPSYGEQSLVSIALYPNFHTIHIANFNTWASYMESYRQDISN